MKNSSRRYAQSRQLSFEDFPAECDDLGFSAAAKGVAAALRRSELPITLAVFGPWGAGKSSFIGLVRRLLQEDSRFIPILFEPWKLESSPNIVYDLVSTIYIAAETSCGPSPDVNLGRQLFQQLEDIHFYDFRRTLLGTIEGAANSQLGVGAHLRSLLERLWPESPSKIAAARIEATLKLPATFSRYIQSLGAIPVVFIDDIDRCRPDTVVSLFEGLKLYLQSRGCSIAFVIAMDYEMVTQAICARYGFSTREDGHQYLDKLCNVSYYVPRPELGGLISRIAGELKRDNDGLGSFWKCAESQDFVDLLFGCNLYLPRKVKRIVREAHAAVASDVYGLATQIRTLSARDAKARYADVSRTTCYRMVLSLFLFRERFPEAYGRLIYRPQGRRADLLLALAENTTHDEAGCGGVRDVSSTLDQIGVSDLVGYLSSPEVLEVVERAFRRDYIFAEWTSDEIQLYEVKLRQEVLNPLLDKLMKT